MQEGIEAPLGRRHAWPSSGSACHARQRGRSRRSRPYRQGRSGGDRREREDRVVDQGYTGEKPAAAAAEHGIALKVIKLPEAKRGFVLLPRRWVVERSFAWATRFRRLVKDYERCAQTLADLHLIAFVCIMLKNVVKLAASP